MLEENKRVGVTLLAPLARGLKDIYCLRIRHYRSMVTLLALLTRGLKDIEPKKMAQFRYTPFRKRGRFEMYSRAFRA